MKTCQSRLLWIAATFFAARLLVVEPASAITLDNFTGYQQAISTSPANPGFSSVPTGGAVGGSRSLHAESTGGIGSLRAEVLLIKRFQHSQDDSVIGFSKMHWDGDLMATNINPVGLAGVDLTDDGGDAFVLSKLTFDYAFSLAITLELRVFDASDPTGLTFSRATIQLNQPRSFEDLFVPFAAFAEFGPNGPCDFSNVGALEILVDGVNPGVDLSFEKFRTNGSCDLLPQANGKVLDACGQCVALDDPSYNQLCADCEGTPNGAIGPGSECNTGELGNCEFGIYSQACVCERLFNPVVESCDGADNNCNGEIDETFPQLGSACGSGEGDCEIVGTFICGQTGGITCDADFDPEQYEECGIIIGCDGIPNSGVVPDRCGVCGGDGTSCPEDCSSVDISSTLYALDGGAKEQEALIRNTTSRIRQLTRKKRYRRFVRETRLLAHARQIHNWILSWQIPSIAVECGESEYCVTTSNLSTLDEYRNGSLLLRNQGREAIRVLGKVQGSKRGLKRYRKRVNARHQANLDLAAQVPVEQTACSSPSD